MNSKDSLFHSQINDTSSVQVRVPAKEQEDKVFSDPKLKYKKDVNENPEAMAGFLSWLSKKLFKGADAEDIAITRRIIIWCIVLLSVVIVVRLLWKSELLGLTKPAPKATAFSFNDITEDLSTVNFDARIKEALGLSDYRLATRWLYLKTLFLMDQNNQISFAPYKTNIDYRYELKNKNLEAGFVSLSRVYEYVWYGQFVVNETHYNKHATEFGLFEKMIHA